MHGIISLLILRFSYFAIQNRTVSYEMDTLTYYFLVPLSPARYIYHISQTMIPNNLSAYSYYMQCNQAQQITSVP